MAINYNSFVENARIKDVDGTNGRGAVPRSVKIDFAILGLLQESHIVDVAYVWEGMGDSLDIDHILEGSLGQPSTTDTGELHISMQI